MKKGFTLIEMLAVVILIGILSVFVISKVKSSINESREATSFASCESLVNVMEKYYFEQKMNGSFNGCIYDFQTNITNCVGFSFSGDAPTSGVLTISNDGIIEGNVVFFDKYNYEIKNNIVINDIYDYNVKQTLDVGKEYKFIYTGSEQVFDVEQTGYYKLEVWGAQGGTYNSTYYGGYGGSSSGYTYLVKDQQLFINVGGQGKSGSTDSKGGYNGGGDGHSYSSYITIASGGGASHIAFKSGLLSSLDEFRDDILIVAGGGSGAYYYSSWTENCGSGNSGGGYVGGYSTDITTAATQSSGFSFGQASDIGTSNSSLNRSGGGGGFYGGFSKWDGMAGGGSGYIANSKLLKKAMYCYNCDESDEESIKTISVSNYSLYPVSNTPKAGDGFVLITYVGNKIP